MTPTLTLTPTLTMTPTFTMTSTMLPTDTATVPCTDQGWAEIDKSMVYVTSYFKGLNAYLKATPINTLMVLSETLALPSSIDSIQHTEVAPCTQEELTKIVDGLNIFLDYCKYISAGAETPANSQIFISQSDISPDKTTAFHEGVKKDFNEANAGLIALKINLSNLHYLVAYINATY